MKRKWQEYDPGENPLEHYLTTWTRNALFALVSDRAGECEPIPPEEWSSPITVSGVSQDCQKQMEEYPGGITGEEESVFDVMTGSMTDPVMMLRFGDDLLFCDNSLLSRAAVESACWPNDNPILGGKYNFLRITMKGPLLCEKLSVLNEYWRGLDDDDCWPCDPPLPMEFTNATIVMDLPVCSGWDASEWSDPGWFDSSWRIVDPPPPKASRPAGTGRRLGNETMDELLDLNDGN